MANHTIINMKNNWVGTVEAFELLRFQRGHSSSLSEYKWKENHQDVYRRVSFMSMDSWCGIWVSIALFPAGFEGAVGVHGDVVGVRPEREQPRSRMRRRQVESGGGRATHQQPVRCITACCMDTARHAFNKIDKYFLVSWLAECAVGLSGSEQGSSFYTPRGFAIARICRRNSGAGKEGLCPAKDFGMLWETGWCE